MFSYDNISILLARTKGETMKLFKFGAVVVGALLSASLVACGANDQSTSTDTSYAGAEKTYAIVTDTAFAPFEYAEDDGTYAGIDVEILHAIAEDQGFLYDLKPVGFDAALQVVQAGKADGVIAGMSITDERKQVFDFSNPYYDSTVCCAVKSGSEIKSMEDLKDKNVAVKNGTMSKKWADSLKDQYGFKTTTFDSSDVMYEDVVTGNSAACFEDTPAMSYAITRHADTKGKEGADLEIISEVEATSDFATPYGFAVSKGSNPELLKKFNDGLANIKQNGTYEQIVTKYVKSVQ